MSKITVREIKEKYLTSKEKEREFRWTYYVRRPVSYYVALPFLNAGISATTVTVIWLVMAAIGCAFLASGSYYNMIIGAVLLELAVIFDCVDGHIARFTRPTRTGDILDTWVGEILLVSSIFSTGIGIANSSDPIITSVISPIAIDRVVYVYLGFFGSLAVLSSWTVRLHWRTIALKLSLTEYEPHRGINRHSKLPLIIDNIFHYSGAFTMVIVVAAILGALDVALITIFIVYGLYLIAIMARIVRKARALDSANSSNLEKDDR
jgi:phosphatidylglycerophosphate synthase